MVQLKLFELHNKNRNVSGSIILMVNTKNVNNIVIDKIDDTGHKNLST